MASKARFAVFLAGLLIVILLAGLLASSAQAAIQDANAIVAGNDPFTFGTAVTEVVPVGGSYAGIGSQVVGLVGGGGTLGTDYMGTTMQLLAGTNNSANPVTISFSWRTRTNIEAYGLSYTPRVIGTNGNKHYANDTQALSPEAYNVTSDVPNMSGMAGPYAAEMTYDPTKFIYDAGQTEATLARDGWIYMGWFEADPNGPAGDIPNLPEWVNAVKGNSTIGGSRIENYQGSWTSFVNDNGGAPLDLNAYLGSWGVDTSTHKVWAVMDHASDFTVVPEPATLSLLALGIAALLRRRK